MLLFLVKILISIVFFFSPQEIDAITTQPSSDDATSHPSGLITTPPKPEVTPAANEGQGQQSTEFEYNTQYSLAGGNCAVFNIKCLFSDYLALLLHLNKLVHINYSCLDNTRTQ